METGLGVGMARRGPAHLDETCSGEAVRREPLFVSAARAASRAEAIEAYRRGLILATSMPPCLPASAFAAAAGDGAARYFRVLERESSVQAERCERR